MIKVMVAAALVAASSALAQTPADQSRLDQLVGWCGNYSDEGDARLCDLYVKSILELLRKDDPVSNMGTRVCTPDDLPVSTFAPEFVSRVRAEPELRTKRAIEVVAMLLKDRYPCR